MAVSKRLRYEVLKRDGHACRYCGRTAPEVKLTIDHVVPTTLGGSDDPSNLVAACGDCNSGKSSSHPDAPLVAAVTDDALRWAQAQQVAAQQMLTDLSRRRETCRRFKSQWQNWTVGGTAVPLPDGWGNSVDNFLAAGLPMEVLLDCLAKAMSNRKIRINDTFRYMCGIAWARVRELQGTARSLLNSRSAAGQQTVDESQYQQAWEDLIGDFPELQDPGQIQALAQQFDEDHEEDEDQHGNPISYSWCDELKALYKVVTGRLIESWALTSTVHSLLRQMPSDLQGRSLAQARDWLAGVDQDATEDEVERYALTLAIEELFPQPPRSGVGF
jgi:hypothetical protein